MFMFTESRVALLWAVFKSEVQHCGGVNCPGFGSVSYWGMNYAPSVFAGVPAARVAVS